MSAPQGGRSLAERAVQALGGGAGVLAGDRPAPQATENRPAPAQGGTTPPPPPRPTQPVITRKAMLAANGRSLEGSRSRCSEELAVIQQQVYRTTRSAPALAGRNPRLVMITSARPNEGKSFTSLNLAIAMARAGVAPVLLVDADGKKDCLSDLLGCGEATGLRILANAPNLAVPPLVWPTEQEGLSFLPYGQGSGSLPPGSALAAALLRVAALFPNHVVIVDAPPALSVSEASALAPVVGQVLLVVRAETTQRSEVEAALDMLDACPTLQLVLNQSRVSATGSFGAYGYESYGAYGRP